MRLNSYVLRSTMVGALGGLLFGFDTAVIAGANHGLVAQFGLANVLWHGHTISQLGITVSIALVGTIVGALTAGPLGQRFGSREMLRLTAVLYLMSAIGCAFAPTWGIFLAARFLGGLGIGGSSVLGPVYIAELAPANIRGRLVGTFQIMIVVGILLAYLSNYVISLASLGAREWRWELGVAAFPAAGFLVLLYTIPRSARWLSTQDRYDEAREVLELMGSPNSAAELEEIRESLHLEIAGRQASLFERINGRFRYGKPILLAFSIALFNQLSGINAILYYLPDIFASAGFSQVSGNMQAVAIGTMNLLATFLGMALIDRVGRKTLLLIGAVGTTACLAFVSAIFRTHSHQALLVWAFVIYIGFFAISQGAVIWVYLSEVFPTRVRNKGQGLGSGTHWVLNAIVSYTFPLVTSRPNGREHAFLFFAVMMAVQFFVVLFYFPETKQVSLEELQKKLKIV
jgi:SP family arabinose:H+ symporter-like MFS transporter